MKTILLVLLFFAKNVLLGTGNFFTVFSGNSLQPIHFVYFFLMLLAAVMVAMLAASAAKRDKAFGTLLGIMLLADPFLYDYTLSVFSLGAYVLCLLPLLIRVCFNGGKKVVVPLSCLTGAAAAALMPVSVGGFVLFANLTLGFLLEDRSPRRLLLTMLPGTLASVVGCGAASRLTLTDDLFRVLYRFDYFSSAITTLSGSRFRFSLTVLDGKAVLITVVFPVLLMGAGFLLTARLKANGKPEHAPLFNECFGPLIVTAVFTAVSAVFFTAVKSAYAPCLFQGVLMLLIFFRHGEVRAELLRFLKRNARYLLPLLILSCAACLSFLNYDNTLMKRIVIYF